MAKYIISIDQSTQGTKALLFDETGSIMRRTDRPHRQIINEKGWVSHDPEEIYSNVLEVVKELLEGVEKEYVVGLGISNQRETSLAWNRVTGKPYGNAVVWQCARAVDICARVEKTGAAEMIRQKTGMNLSPYFPASKAFIREIFSMFREYKSFKRRNILLVLIRVVKERSFSMRQEAFPPYHRQIINEKGWVSHDPEEIYSNVLAVVKELLEGVEKECVVGLGISNQRETSLAWNKVTGKPYGNAVVWQCARAVDICARVEKAGAAELIRQKTGMNLSPYFPASKIAWLLENEEGAKAAAERHEICHGTIDSWLVYKLTGGKEYRTDYSNASRTQLFNIFDLKWDEEICGLFGIDPANMAEVTDSDACFGETDFEGLLPHKIPIHGVLGDSHGSLFGQGCLQPGMIKSTYGTGSSIMMNIGEKPILSTPWGCYFSCVENRWQG